MATIERENNMSETNKVYELRKLTSKDVFPMFRIISKIGVKEFKECFESEEIKSLISGKKADANAVEADANAVGFAVVLNIAGVVISNIPKAEDDIFNFLASLSGMERKDVEALDLAVFAEMIIDIVKKEEFKDFIGVVSKLFK